MSDFLSPQPARRCIAGIAGIAVLVLAPSSSAQKADIFGDDTVFVIEATPIEAVETEQLPVEAAAQVERLRSPPVAAQLTPLRLPAADFSDAVAETEPNDRPEQASPMQASMTASGATQGSDTDYFVFTIAPAADGVDAARLWAIEARGSMLAELGYLSRADGKVVQSKVQGSGGEDAHRFVLANLLLYPGDHRIWVRGRGSEAGAYKLRAVPLGPHDPLAEAEPNDDDSRAHPLEFGQTRTGHLYAAGDKDVYYFNLSVASVVKLHLEPPGDIDTEVTLGLAGAYGGGRQYLKTALEAGRDSFEQTRALPPGAYAVRLHATGTGSAEPYRVGIERLYPGALPIDLEPNDTPLQASPLPPDHRIHGTPTQRGDNDYYRLPVLAPGTRITIRSDRTVGLAERRRLAVIPASGSANAPGIVKFDQASNAWQGSVPTTTPTDTAYVARVQAWLTDYAYRFEFHPTPMPAAQGPPEVELVVPDAPLAVAAYLERSQRLRLPIEITNSSELTQHLSLSMLSSNPDWRTLARQEELRLGPGESQSIASGIIVPPDAGDIRPVEIAITLTGAGGSLTRTVTVAPICGLAPVDARRTWPLPSSLLGGLNVAATAFGGESAERGAGALLDQRTPYTTGWSSRLAAATVTIDLAGEGPISIAGVVLNPRTSAAANTRPRRFRIDTSTDGARFTPRLEGELTAVGHEQAFAFDRTVQASHVRLTVLDTQEGDSRNTSLGELKVIAAPATRPLGDGLFNLADPVLGGHVVWSDPPIGRRPASLLTDGRADTDRRKLDVTRPNRWVIGFHHGRAAQIVQLEWTQPPDRADTRRMTQVSVAAADSPLGPWSPLGTWELEDAPGASSRLVLPRPTWARYLQFTHTQAQIASEWWHDAETLRVLERPAADEYRSILGEWGQYRSHAIYEFLTPADDPARERAESTDVPGTPAEAAPLALNTSVAGSVRVGDDEDWYRLQIPPGHNRLRLELGSNSALRVRPVLRDGDGQEVTFARTDRDAAATVFETQVDGDTRYLLQLAEPPRSVLFVWDNSSSVTPYIAQIYRALARFAKGLTTGREEGNLLALGAGTPLLNEWARHPFELQKFLTNYDRSHSSSAAEIGMTAATRALAERDGTRAVVFIADGLSGERAQPAELWRLFDRTPVRIFPLELQGSSSTPHQQDVMQSWARVDGGVYDYFGTAEDLEHGFARASCLIRRPADYRLLATTRKEQPPAPGSLEVLVDANTPPNAVEIILDASGSMWAQIDGKARISIAHDVLAELVSEAIPAGTPLALRIFGHREARSCRTDLEVPLRPLDPAAVIRSIRAAKPKERSRTPLAASLASVSSDLARADGSRVVVLLTDGKETCGGDPAASIEALKAASQDIRINIVGFAIDDASLASEFERWAILGGGRYFAADSEADLGNAMQKALHPKFQVLDAAANIVAEGTAGDSPVTLPPGTYTVRLMTSPTRRIDGVDIAPGQLRQLRID
jgi:hypothetical protein